MTYLGQIRRKLVQLKIIIFAFFLVWEVGLNHHILYAQDNDQELIESLEEEPETELENENDSLAEEKWQVLYLKASYRHYYRLKLSYTNDEFSIPFNLEQKEMVNQSLFSNIYGSDSKIHLTDTLFSFLRFDYSFRQTYDHDSAEYQNSPEIHLYEAYLSYQKGKHWLRVGGLQMRLGKVDFDSPIDILHLKDTDKTNHLDKENTKFIMPAVTYNIVQNDSSWAFYWGPFQRISQDKQSLRANAGVQYKIASGSMDTSFGLFSWFDPENEIIPELQRTPDSTVDVLEIRSEDTTISFVTMDFDVVLGETVLKADFGYFWKKNFYHIAKNPTIEAEATTDVFELKTLGLKHFALAISLEKKFERLFLMPTYSYRRIFDVPADTHIFQYENLEEPASEIRNLERHQIGTFLRWDWKDNLQIDLLFFYSFPFQRSGFSGETIWKPMGERSKWRFLLSRIETAVNKMSHRKTILNRIQYSYSLQF